MQKSILKRAFSVLLIISSSLLWAANEADILAIRRVFNAIEKNLTTFEKIERGPLWRSTEGGSTTCYLDEGKFYKIVIATYGETGKSIDSYYFDKNILIFVYEHSYHYNQHIMDEEFSWNKVEETTQRNYFKGAKLIRRLDTEKNELAFSETESPLEFEQYNQIAKKAKALCMSPEKDEEEWY